MEWDQKKIDAAVSTLTGALGTTCDVQVNTTKETAEVAPHGGFRQYEIVPNTEKCIITITAKE